MGALLSPAEGVVCLHKPPSTAAAAAQDLGEMHKVTALKTLQTHSCLPRGDFFQSWEVLETLLMSSAEEITQGTVGEGRLVCACEA